MSTNSWHFIYYFICADLPEHKKICFLCRDVPTWPPTIVLFVTILPVENTLPHATLVCCELGKSHLLPIIIEYVCWVIIENTTWATNK